MNTTKLTKPADLDNSLLHSRAEYRAWQDAVARYHAQIRDAEIAEIKKEEEQLKTSYLTNDQYDQIARENDAQRRLAFQLHEASRQAIKQDVENAKKAALATMPDFYNIQETSLTAFVQELSKWLECGKYKIDSDSVEMIGLAAMFTCTVVKKTRKKEE